MEHLLTYKLFEEETQGLAMGDTVLILFKLPGTEQREMIPVKIVKKVNNSNSYEVSFQVDTNPISNHKNIMVKGSKIIGPYHQLKEPLNPNYLSQQPTPTDYNKPGNMGGGGVSNDVQLPTG